MRRITFPLLFLLPAAVFAHAGDDGAWRPDPWMSLLLLGIACLYGRGWLRMRSRGSRGRKALRRKAWLFAAGMSCLAVALVSPLDRLAAAMASAHMVQHMLLIIAAAPLLVLSAPLPIFLWAMPETWRHGVAHGSQHSLVSNTWKMLTMPLVAWFLHGAFLWLWHVPVLYEAALRNRLVHDLEHASFLANALLFWWVVLRALAQSAARNGTAVLLLFTTFLHGGLLAALMTFSTTPWYDTYVNSAARWGMSAGTDQQLAGLIMWIPAGITYMAAGLIVLGLWLHRMDHPKHVLSRANS